MYNDSAGYCTIGYGHLIKKASCDGSEPRMFLEGLTEPAGEQLLVSDMTSARYTVMTAVPIELTDGQFAALSDFVFNVGSARFRASTLLRAVNARDLDRIATQFRRWVKAGGKVWPGLQTRREAEIDLYFTGLPRSRRTPSPDEDVSPIDIRLGERAGAQNSSR